MAFSSQTLDELSQWARGLFAKAVDGAVVSIWPNTWYVLGKVMALIAQAFYQRIGWLYKQMFLSTATSAAMVQRHCFEVGVNPIAGVAATGNVVFPVAAGLASVPAGVQAQRDADGTTFTTTSAVAVSGSTVSLPFAADDVGAYGNTDAGATLTLLYPDDWPQLGPQGVVDSAGLGGGADAETKEHLRARGLQKKRNPPNGGSAADWVRWVEATSGAITGVWVDSFVNNARQVWIAFARSDRTDGVPTSADVTALAAAIAANNERPVTARPTFVAIAPSPVAVTLTRLIPNTAAVQAAIETELKALFASYAPTGTNGAYVAPATPNAPFVLPADWIDEAIGRAPGLSSFTRVAPTGDLTFSTPGEIPSYQAPSYV